MMPSKAIKLVEDNDPSMTNFDLSNNTVFQMKSMEYVAKLTKALQTNTTVKEVHLQNCMITDSMAAQFGAVLKVNETITELDLGNNKITSQGLVSLAVGLAHNKTLKHLVLIGQNSRFGEAALACVVKMFETNTTLTKITWRLDSKQAWAITRACTRNVEIERRLSEGMSVDHLDPNIKRERDTAAGLENTKPGFAKDMNISSGGSKSVIMRKPSAGRLKSPRRRGLGANDQKITRSPAPARRGGRGSGRGRGARGGARGGGAAASPAKKEAPVVEEKAAATSTADQDALKAERDAIKAEQEALKAERESIKAEREELEAAKAAFAKEKEENKAEAPAPDAESSSGGDDESKVAALEAEVESLKAKLAELDDAKAEFEKEKKQFEAEKSAFEADKSTYLRKQEEFKSSMLASLDSM